MSNTTVFDIYVKGELVFSYVRGRGDFTEDDIEVKVYDSYLGISGDN